MSLLNKKEGIYENDILLNCFYKTSFHDLSRGVFIYFFMSSCFIYLDLETFTICVIFHDINLDFCMFPLLYNIIHLKYIHKHSLIHTLHKYIIYKTHFSHQPSKTPQFLPSLFRLSLKFISIPFINPIFLHLP